MKKRNTIFSHVTILSAAIIAIIFSIAQFTSAPSFAQGNGSEINDAVTTPAIPWEPIKEKDVLWKKRVWREIDSLQNNALVPQGNRLINVLIEGINSGKIKAYSANDDRFSKELTKEEFSAILASQSNIGNVNKFSIKEDWIFVKDTGKMYVRILGIAPVQEIPAATGTTPTKQPLFWIYYPKSRDFLAQHQVQGIELSATYNWDEFFESRKFSSKIVRVSNPANVNKLYENK